MKRNKKMKFEVKGPEAIEDGLMGMGRAIEAGGPSVAPNLADSGGAFSFAKASENALEGLRLKD